MQSKLIDKLKNYIFKIVMKKSAFYFSVFIICTLFINISNIYGQNNIESITFNKETIQEQHYRSTEDVSHRHYNNNDLKNLTKEDYVPGVIQVKFHKDFEDYLKNIDLKSGNSGYVKTGIPALDRINKNYKIHEYKWVIGQLYEFSEVSKNNKFKHKEWGLHRWYDLRIDKKSDLIEAVKELRKLKEIEYAEPEYRIFLIEPIVGEQIKSDNKDNNDKGWSPNDMHYHKQWGLNNTGQNGGLEGWDIDAERAWEIETGNSNVIVGVIDTGVQYDHPDLAPNMFEDIGPQGESTVPDMHGTHVAGTVAAASNNSIGVAGVAGGSGDCPTGGDGRRICDGVRIMSIDLLSGDGVVGNPLPIYTYMVDHGVAISQNSWSSGPNFNHSIREGIDLFNEEGGGTALDGGITIFAAGNSNSDEPNFPGYYEGTIAVGGYNRRGEKWEVLYGGDGGSNYGYWVDISAPAVDIYSTDKWDGTFNYRASTGTSMAAPHVSGVAALLVSKAYGELNNQVLKNILLESAREELYDINPDYIGLLGTGAVDAFAALELLSTLKKVTFEIEDTDGVEIDSAVVTIDDLQNEPGDYSFMLIDKCDQTLDYKVEKYGYITVEDQILMDDDEITVNIVMEVAPVVTFVIEDEDNNEIDDATIIFGDDQKEPGDYIITVHKYGNHEYSVHREGYLIVRDDIYVDDDATINITMEPAYIITFEVEDTEGAEIDDAVITFNEVQNSSGEYVFEIMEEGTYEYIVERQNFLTYKNDVYVDGDATINVIMDPAYIVTFEVENLEGAEINDAIITFNGVQNSPGNYEFSIVEEDNYNFIVERQDYFTYRGDVYVESDTTLLVVMDDPLIVLFDVKDQDYNDITDAVVTFNRITNPPGDYQFNAPAVRTYRYEVERQGYYDVAQNINVTRDMEIIVIMERDGTFIEEIDHNYKVSIYPNPAFTNFAIETNQEISNISIINLNGRLIKKIDNVNGFKTEIDASNIDSGAYFLNIKFKNDVSVNKKIQIIN